MLKDRGRIER